MGGTFFYLSLLATLGLGLAHRFFPLPLSPHHYLLLEGLGFFVAIFAAVAAIRSFRTTAKLFYLPIAASFIVSGTLDILAALLLGNYFGQPPSSVATLLSYKWLIATSIVGGLLFLATSSPSRTIPRTLHHFAISASSIPLIALAFFLTSLALTVQIPAYTSLIYGRALFLIPLLFFLGAIFQLRERKGPTYLARAVAREPPPFVIPLLVSLELLLASLIPLGGSSFFFDPPLLWATLLKLAAYLVFTTTLVSSPIRRPAPPSQRLRPSLLTLSVISATLLLLIGAVLFYHFLASERRGIARLQLARNATTYEDLLKTLSLSAQRDDRHSASLATQLLGDAAIFGSAGFVGVQEALSIVEEARFDLKAINPEKIRGLPGDLSPFTREVAVRAKGRAFQAILLAFFLLTALLFASQLYSILHRPIVKLRRSLEARKKALDTVGIREIEDVESAIEMLFARLELLYRRIYLERQKRKAASQFIERLGSVILEDIADPVVFFDREGRIVQVNKAALRLFGVPRREDVLGRLGVPYIQQKLSPESRLGRPITPDENPAARTARTGRAVTTMLYLRTRGSKIPYVVTSSPVSAAHKTFGTVLTFKDLTEHERLEQARSEFISIASHQLRTPLSSIKWFTELLLEEKKLPRSSRSYIASIAESVERLIDLVNALLNISRIESGTLSIEPKDVGAGEMVDQVLSDLRGLIRAKRQTIVVSPRQGLKLRVDPDILRNVLQNLISNAVKYSPERKKVEIAMRREGRLIRFTIKDHGWGIPKEEQRKVFQKFFRSEKILERVTEGSGLGLYITKSLVEISGGKIGFQSKEGKGSTFWFTLPVRGLRKRGLGKKLAIIK